jgi:hypothetical protein
MQIKTIILLPLFAFVLFTGCNSNNNGTQGSTTPARVNFTGVASHGIFDPSISLDPANNRFWMSYSAVDPSVNWPTQNPDAVSIRLAYSDDNGKTWSDSGSIVSNFLDVTIPLAAPNNAGTWINEVSQLIYDAGASQPEKWKILWHHYLLLNGTRHAEHGWIAMKTASRPKDLATAPEIKLFSGYLYDTSNNTLGGTSGSPVGGAPQIQLDTALNSALNTCVFTEPGMYASNSALYVSLQCEHLANSDRLIVLLKCISPCNAGNSASWAYLGNVLQKSDASAFGFDSGFAAPGIFASSGNIYLLATPVQTAGAPWPDYYKGCRVFKFSDIDTALLQKSGSQPTVIGSIDGTAGSFNGACSYHVSASDSGIMFSELNTSVNDKFQIFESHTNF